jgi:hypothetical protein
MLAVNDGCRETQIPRRIIPAKQAHPNPISAAGSTTSRQGNVRTPLSPSPFPRLSQGKGRGLPESPPSSSAEGGIEGGGAQQFSPAP